MLDHDRNDVAGVAFEWPHTPNGKLSTSEADEGTPVDLETSLGMATVWIAQARGEASTVHDDAEGQLETNW